MFLLRGCLRMRQLSARLRRSGSEDQLRENQGDRSGKQALQNRVLRNRARRQDAGGTGRGKRREWKQKRAGRLRVPPGICV